MKTSAGAGLAFAVLAAAKGFNADIQVTNNSGKPMLNTTVEYLRGLVSNDEPKNFHWARIEPDSTSESQSLFYTEKASHWWKISWRYDENLRCFSNPFLGYERHFLDYWDSNNKILIKIQKNDGSLRYGIESYTHSSEGSCRCEEI